MNFLKCKQQNLKWVMKFMPKKKTIMNIKVDNIYNKSMYFKNKSTKFLL